MLRIGTAVWWSLCMLQHARHAVETAVWDRWRHRPLTEGGWPTRRHPDRLGPGLSGRDEVWLAGIDTEITGGLPLSLRVALTRSMASRGRAS
jgi:hypothetical protein